MIKSRKNLSIMASVNTPVKSLSKNAQLLLSVLKQRNVWEDDAIKIFFPEPEYIGTLDPAFSNEQKESAQVIYWQWETNLYGNAHSRPVLGFQREFKINVEQSYRDTTYAAYVELRDAGYANAKNNGYNTYSYYSTGK